MCSQHVYKCVHIDVYMATESSEAKALGPVSLPGVALLSLCVRVLCVHPQVVLPEVILVVLPEQQLVPATMDAWQQMPAARQKLLSRD